MLDYTMIFGITEGRDLSFDSIMVFCYRPMCLETGLSNFSISRDFSCEKLPFYYCCQRNKT